MPPSVLRPPSSALRPLSSALRRLSSVLRSGSHRIEFDEGDGDEDEQGHPGPDLGHQAGKDDFRGEHLADKGRDEAGGRQGKADQNRRLHGLGIAELPLVLLEPPRLLGEGLQGRLPSRVGVEELVQAPLVLIGNLVAAVVGVGAVVATENGRFKDVRIALGAVAPTPMRATKAEALLKGEKVSDGMISKASQLASEESKPIDDHRASAEYRRMMVEVLVRRAVSRATKE